MRSIQPGDKSEEMGSSESENPFVLLGPFIVEAVGVEVIIEVGVGIIAAIAAIAVPKKFTPKDECADKYSTCMDSPLGNLVVDVRGTSLCETCRKLCQKDEAWPAAVKVTQRWHSCR